MRERSEMSHATRLSRRSFLAKSAQGAVIATFAIAGTDSAGAVLGSSDTIHVGVAGIHGRGQSHIDEFTKAKGVQVTHLIDPDSSLFESRSKSAGGKPVCVQDVRRALDDKDLDAISVATCNHWHSLITIWACQAGKDVYVEKPLSHNIYEGRKAVEAARKYGRIVQHGTQQRSSGGRAKEIAAVHSAHYGKLLVSKGYCCKPRWSIGEKAVEPPPSYLDFDIWLGPAPKQDYHGNLVHYNWHWFWDTGNGDIGNQGVHEMDVARWAIRGATLPKKVLSLGGRFGYVDQGETPNTQMAVMQYDDAVLLFEVRGLVGGRSKDRNKVANEFYTTEGMIADGKFWPKGGGAAESLKDFGGSVRPGGNFGNFIDCVRSRKVEDLNADVLEGHYSAALCHLANISYRLGEPTRFNEKSNSFGDDKVVYECFQALENNLTKGVGLKLEDLEYHLGRTLELDVEAERFRDDDRANALVAREYRAPFVVPATV